MFRFAEAGAPGQVARARRRLGKDLHGLAAGRGSRAAEDLLAVGGHDVAVVDRGHVRTVAAVDRVDERALHEEAVIPGASVDRVQARVAEDRVVAGSARQVVVAGAAVDVGAERGVVRDRVAAAAAANADRQDRRRRGEGGAGDLVRRNGRAVRAPRGDAGAVRDHECPTGGVADRQVLDRVSLDDERPWRRRRGGERRRGSESQRRQAHQQCCPGHDRANRGPSHRFSFSVAESRGRRRDHGTRACLATLDNGESSGRRAPARLTRAPIGRTYGRPPAEPTDRRAHGSRHAPPNALPEGRPRRAVIGHFPAVHAV